MADSNTTAFADMMKPVEAMFAMNPLISSQVEHFWSAQDAVLKEAEAFASGWFKRRHMATSTAMDVAKDMMSDGATPFTAMQAMGDWQAQSMERLAEDFQSFADMGSNCMNGFLSAEMDVEMQALEEGEKMVKKTTTRAKHAMPV